MQSMIVFITSHKRPECPTYYTLRNAGYTGKIVVVLDDEDDRAEEYKEFSRMPNTWLCKYNKQRYIDYADTGTSKNPAPRASVLYPRMAVEDTAIALNSQYFVVMDDDIYKLRFRYVENGQLKSYNLSKKNRDLDKIFDAYTDFMDSADLLCTSFATGQVFIGGAGVFESGKSMERRSCHNIFIRRLKKPLLWKFAMNEDYITSLLYAQSGELLFTLPFVQQDMAPMNNYSDNTGGMYQFYQDTTDFQRAFYSTVAVPSAATPKFLNNHWIIGVDKNAAYPKIISERYKHGTI